MMDAWQCFIDDLVRVDLVRLARDEAIREWGGDIPTTLMFAKLGKVIADKFDDFRPEERTQIFDALEAGIGSSDTALKTYIATGLLEAVFSRVSGDIALWKRIDAQLGEVSRNYLIEWRRL